MLAFIEREANLRLKATEIHKELSKRCKDGEWPLDVLPSLRTVQRILKAFECEQDITPWSWTNGLEKEAVRPMLDVVALVSMLSEGRKLALTEGEARWLVQLQRAMPDADPFLVWTTCRSYIALPNRGGDTQGLDSFLAFAPWKDSDHFRRYCKGLVMGWIPPAPLGMICLVVPEPFGWCLAGTTLERLTDGSLTLSEWSGLEQESEKSR